MLTVQRFFTSALKSGDSISSCVVLWPLGALDAVLRAISAIDSLPCGCDSRAQGRGSGVRGMLRVHLEATSSFCAQRRFFAAHDVGSRHSRNSCALNRASGINLRQTMTAIKSPGQDKSMLDALRNACAHALRTPGKRNANFASPLEIEGASVYALGRPEAAAPPVDPG